MTYDEILGQVEKKPIGQAWGGKFPLNQAMQQVLDKYLTVGQILEGFFGVANASKDERLDYRRDEYWFRQLDVLDRKQQAQLAAQQSQPGPDAQPGGDQQSGGDQQEAAPQGKRGQPGSSTVPGQPGKPAGAPDVQQPQPAPAQDGPDLSTGIDQLAGILNKSEGQLPTSKRHLLAQQRLFISHAMSALEEEAKVAIKEITAVTKKHFVHAK
jgi:hypothetical protein